MVIPFEIITLLRNSYILMRTTGMYSFRVVAENSQSFKECIQHYKIKLVVEVVCYEDQQLHHVINNKTFPGVDYCVVSSGGN